MNKKVAQKIDQYDIDYCKNWLCDTTPINVRQGLMHITAFNSLYGPIYDGQMGNIVSKLMRYNRFAGFSVTIKDGTVTVDDVVTMDASNFEPDILDHIIRSRPKFVKLIYQYMSCFPVALYKTYTEVTRESLILDNLSEVRDFYEKCSTFDSWTARQLCAFISHCDPEALDHMSENPEDLLFTKFTPIFSRSDLYEENLPLVKAAILGGAFEFIHVDRNNLMESSLKPKKGLEWAKQKGIEYQPVLDEYLLTLDTEPAISSGYNHSLLRYDARGYKGTGAFERKSGKKRGNSRFVCKKTNGS